MPSRILRDWTDSDRFDGLSAEAERLFTRLLMKADDFGRFHAETRRVRSACFPLLTTLRPSDIDGWLLELAERRLILRYRVDDRDLLAIPRFGQRLKMDKSGKIVVVPKFPPMPGFAEPWLPGSEHFPEVPGSAGKCPPYSYSYSYSESKTETEAGATPPNSFAEAVGNALGQAGVDVGDDRPAGDGGRSQRVGEILIPPKLSSIAFTTAWTGFMEYLQAKGKPPTVHTQMAWMSEAVEKGEQAAISAMAYAVKKNAQSPIYDAFGSSTAKASEKEDRKKRVERLYAESQRNKEAHVA